MREELLTEEEVAAILGVDKRTVLAYRNLKENPLPFVKLQAAVRFIPESVKAWIKSREKNAQGEQASSTQRPNNSTRPKGTPKP